MLVKPFERPSRAQIVLDAIQSAKIGPILKPTNYGTKPVLAVHDVDFVKFLTNVWQEWKSSGYKGEAIPTVWPVRRMQQRIPNFIDGKLGYYSMAAETSITQGTWTAALVANDVALSGAAIIATGERGAFALCRPPGHHAAHDMFGGYCFLNNAAIAAQWLLDSGFHKVSILDVDFHHGNGTQDIFYERDDVLFCSIHGDPKEAFPHFLGYSDERGQGVGKGFNHNYPMPRGTTFAEYKISLQHSLNHISDFQGNALVVSVGVDTFENDPISFFRLQRQDYAILGEMISSLHLPTLFVLEGGYDLKEMGENIVSVLRGFERSI